MPRAARLGPSVAKPSAGHWRAWEGVGSGPRTGSPAPIRRPAEKKRRDRLMTRAVTHPPWALGWGDEGWGRRLAHPALHRWPPDDQPLRLHELTFPRPAQVPKALACYGLLVRQGPNQPEQMVRRFVERRPVSRETTALLAWYSARLAAQGGHALLLIWDKASWHMSPEVRRGLRQHHRPVQQTGQGVRLVACRLPSTSPWLNPIEPTWVHGKRAIVAPDRVLRAQEVMDRVYAYYGCAEEAHQIISEKAA
jgi:DDE superfamily endonuclease